MKDISPWAGFSGICTALLYVCDTDANLFANFQLGASNLEKDEYLKKKKETLSETNIKLCNVKFEKVKIWEGVAIHKKAKTKGYYLKL